MDLRVGIPADEYGELAPPGEGYTARSPEEAREMGARIRRESEAEEAQLQAALVRKIPAVARPLAAMNRRQGFQHPLVSRIARFGWIVRPLVRAQTRARGRATRRQVRVRSGSRGDPSRLADDEHDLAPAVAA